MLQRRRLASPTPHHDQSHAIRELAHLVQQQHLHQPRKTTSHQLHRCHQVSNQNQHSQSSCPILPILLAIWKEGLYPRRMQGLGLPRSTARVSGGTGPNGGVGEEGMMSPTLGLKRAAGWTATHHSNPTAGGSPTPPASHGNSTAGGSSTPPASHGSYTAGGSSTPTACRGSPAAGGGSTPPAASYC